MKYYGIIRSQDYLEHYGVKGMQWGKRKAREYSDLNKHDTMLGRSKASGEYSTHSHSKEGTKTDHYRNKKGLFSKERRFDYGNGDVTTYHNRGAIGQALSRIKRKSGFSVTKALQKYGGRLKDAINKKLKERDDKHFKVTYDDATTGSSGKKKKRR